jgi:probable rRNA maturation factor
VKLHVQNRQRAVRFDVKWLRRFAPLAFEKCREISDDGRFALRRIAELNVVIVSDRRIARLHEDFMDITGATDVITFDHGEIVMSAETARCQAAEYDQLIEEELALYTVHGLLHLNGFEDSAPKAAARMRQIQSRVLQECLAQLPAR